MPYIVPSTAPSPNSGTTPPPHSPSRPPMAFSMALANPAPVPAHTPFTPPEIPTSPPLASSSAFNAQAFVSSAKAMGYVYPPQAPPLVKALSDTHTATTSSPSKSLELGASSSLSHSPPMRRAVSASNASPVPSAYRYTNTAGSSLPRIPRRRGGSATSFGEVQTSGSPMQARNTPPRGRTRSRFVLGGEEESTSGSDEERRRRIEEGSGKSTGGGVEERTARKRHVSADRPMALKRLSPSLSLSRPSASGYAMLDFDHSESSSECATPTQSSVARSHLRHERGSASPLKAAADIKDTSSLNVGRPNIPGAAPRACRGRGRDGARKIVFRDDQKEEVTRPRDETSTVAFPLSKPPSPPPAIAVAAPTPEVTPFSSPQQDINAKSFSGKRANAGSLHLDFSFGGQNVVSTTDHVQKNPSTEHSRTLSESASLNSVPLIRKKSGEVVRSSLKSRSSSANAARQRPSLSLGDISSLARSSPSVSAPTTPASGKMVHFDTQLEHVKVFKSTSKPAAVSRTGSPTYDDTTSGGEGDSASEGGSLADFIPRPRPKRLVPGGTTNEEEEAVRRVLMMRVLNMPHRTMETDDVDVRLEALHLADDASSVQGIVRVRNIAFEKTVAVRFTFDGWQTTSEVIGRWSGSCIPQNPVPSGLTLRPRLISTPVNGIKADKGPTPAFDRFTFSIRLADLFLRIDEKTLVLAVRYCSAGREMWDNNDSQNYRAVFERRAQHSLTLTGSAVVTVTSPDLIKEKGKGGEEGRQEGSTSGLSSGSPVSKDGGPGGPLSPVKKGSDLSSRYDLDTSLKNPSTWRPTFEQLKTWAGRGWSRDNEHTHTPSPTHSSVKSSMTTANDLFNAHSFESFSLNFNARGLPRGSPRDLDRDTMEDPDVERYNRARFAVSENVSMPDGEPFPRYHGGASTFVSPPTSWACNGMESNVRNHHRSYFDAWASLSVASPNFGARKVRRTPPGTPTSLPIHRTLSDPNADTSPSRGALHLVTPSTEHTPASSPSRYHSFPPLMPAGNGKSAAGLGLLASRPWPGMSRGMRQDSRGSEASTPSITSGSSPTMTASPSSPPDFSSLTPTAHIDSIAVPDSESMDMPSYNAFLSSFCFFRGSDGQLGVPATDIHRTRSVSEVEELLSTPPTSSTEAFLPPKEAAQTSPGSTSRSTTPTNSAGSEGLSSDDLSPPPTSAGLLKTESAISTRVHG